jgi:predicted hotdog family 3-hydroxylacyl-ACP dehydratase
MGAGAEDLSALLPHRPPMLLLEALAEAGPAGGTALARVDPGAWYADAEGAMPAWIGLELMAQAAAAWRGAGRAPGSGPGAGFLVAVRAYRSAVAVFPAGARLEVRVRLEGAEPGGLCAFECHILEDGRLLAEGRIRVKETA